MSDFFSINKCLLLAEIDRIIEVTQYGSGLYHLQMHKSLWAMWDPPKRTDGVDKSAHQTTLSFTISPGSPWRSQVTFCKLASVMAIYKKGQKQDLGNYKPQAGA